MNHSSGAGLLSALPQDSARLPVAMYEFGSEARKKVTQRLNTLPGGYRVMYNSPYIAGQVAVAESGLALSVLTRCCAPAHLVMPQTTLLPESPVLDIAVVNSELQQGNLISHLLVDEIINTFRKTR